MIMMILEWYENNTELIAIIMIIITNLYNFNSTLNMLSNKYCQLII